MRYPHRDGPLIITVIVSIMAVLFGVMALPWQANDQQPAKIATATRRLKPPDADAPFDELEARQAQQRWADYLGVKPSFVNSVGIEFRLIPPGKFMMGSSRQESEDDNAEVHFPAAVDRPFYLSTTEITQRQWTALMGTKPWLAQIYGVPGADLPATYVSLDDALMSIEQLNSKENTQRYRLPTEVEWEYACRAGTTTAYYFGDDPDKLDDHAWTMSNTHVTGGEDPPSVGKKGSNPFGLFDMHGNVIEMCASPVTLERKMIVNPFLSRHKSSDRKQIGRGGSWFGPTSLRSASRTGIDRTDGAFWLGFRLAAETDRAAVPPPSYEQTIVRRTGKPPVNYDKELKVTDTWPNGETSLHIAIKIRDHLAFTRLLEEGADPNACDSEGKSVMHLAAEQKDTSWLPVAAKYGGSVDALNRGNRYLPGCTPLFYAIRKRRLDCIRELIALGADVNHRDARGETPVLLAGQFPEAIIPLLEAGADPEATDEHGDNLLNRVLTARDIRLAFNPHDEAELKAAREKVEKMGYRIKD